MYKLMLIVVCLLSFFSLYTQENANEWIIQAKNNKTITGTCFSDDGLLYVSSGEDKTIIINTTCDCIVKILNVTNLKSLCLSEDNSLLGGYEEQNNLNRMRFFIYDLQKDTFFYSQPTYRYCNGVLKPKIHILNNLNKIYSSCNSIWDYKENTISSIDIDDNNNKHTTQINGVPLRVFGKGSKYAYSAFEEDLGLKNKKSYLVIRNLKNNKIIKKIELESLPMRSLTYYDYEIESPEHNDSLIIITTIDPWAKSQDSSFPDIICYNYIKDSLVWTQNVGHFLSCRSHFSLDGNMVFLTIKRDEYARDVILKFDATKKSIVDDMKTGCFEFTSNKDASFGYGYSDEQRKNLIEVNKYLGKKEMNFLTIEPVNSFSVKQLEMLVAKTLIGPEVSLADTSNITFRKELDGSISMFRQNVKIAAIYIFKNGQSLIIANDSLYMASKDFESLLVKRKGELHPFTEIDLIYNNPAGVLDHLGARVGSNFLDGLTNAYQIRKKMNLTSSVAATTNLSPLVQVIGVPNKKNYEFSDLSLKIRAKDSLAGLQNIYIYINEIPLYGKNGILITGKYVELERKMELLPGKNVIQIFVKATNNRYSRMEQFEVNCITEPKRGNLHLIVVGISDYRLTKLKNLKYAKKDAEDIELAFLSRPGVYNKIYIHKYIDALAKRESILAVRKKLLETATNDQVIFFFAGHGIIAGEKLENYFVTYDGNFNDPKRVGISFKELEDLVDAIPARFRLFLIDACESGEIDQGGLIKISQETTFKTSVGFRSKTSDRVSVSGQEDFKMMKDLFLDLRRNSGAYVISAATGTEFAREADSLKNGVFTSAILSGLFSSYENDLEKGTHNFIENITLSRTSICCKTVLRADLNKDKQISLNELSSYVGKTVSRITNGAQNPEIRYEYIYNSLNFFSYDYDFSWPEIKFKGWEDIQVLIYKGATINREFLLNVVRLMPEDSPEIIKNILDKLHNNARFIRLLFGDMKYQNELLRVAQSTKKSLTEQHLINEFKKISIE